MACNSTCNQCNQCQEWCSCKPVPVIGVCIEETSSKCIIYKPEGGVSAIDKFIGFETKRNTQDIFERLDSKLYALNSIQAPLCAKNLLQLPDTAELSMVIYKILNFLCTADNTKVKINATDKTSGYLYDKISLGDCIVKSVVTDQSGNSTLKLELDYDCVSDKLNDISWADVVPTETTCNGSDLYTKQVNTNGEERWKLTTPNHASCIACTPSWVDVAPKVVGCEVIGEYSLQLTKKQQDGCNNIRWVDDGIFTWGASTVDCSTGATIAQLVSDPAIPTEFAIDDGSGNLTWLTDGDNTYSITGLAKDGSLKNFKARPTGQTCTIGGILQMCVGDAPCNEESWTNTETVRCEADVSEIQQVSNCGTFRWVAGGDECNACNDPVPLISITVDDADTCGTQKSTLTAVESDCDTIAWYKKIEGNSDVQLGTGSTLEVVSNATVYAKCTNCTGTVTSNNEIVITHSPNCDGTCTLPSFNLTNSQHTCNVTTWVPNLDGYISLSSLVNGDKFAVYPNTDGTGVVPSYANAIPATNNVLVKANIGTSQTVRVRVYNGAENCFTEKAYIVTVTNCLAACVQVTVVTMATNNATPAVGDSVLYTATPDGSAPYTYVWKIDGVPVGGETASTFTKAWIAGDLGNRVVTVDVTNCLANGTATGTISVDVRPSITAISSSSDCPTS